MQYSRCFWNYLICTWSLLSKKHIQIIWISGFRYRTKKSIRTAVARCSRHHAATVWHCNAMFGSGGRLRDHPEGEGPMAERCLWWRWHWQWLKSQKIWSHSMTLLMTILAAKLISSSACLELFGNLFVPKANGCPRRRLHHYKIFEIFLHTLNIIYANYFVGGICSMVQWPCDWISDTIPVAVLSYNPLCIALVGFSDSIESIHYVLQVANTHTSFTKLSLVKQSIERRMPSSKHTAYRIPIEQ